MPPDMVKCSITECRADSAVTVRIGSREKRNLCRYHHNLLKNKDRQFRPEFKKASGIEPRVRATD